MRHYDTIIIGAGPNGLVCATYLAEAGQSVLVLEAADTPGGLASTREFHPGFRVSVAHTLQHFPSEIAADLKLSRHGYVNAGSPIPTIGLDIGGDHVQVTGDSVVGVTDPDATKYRDYIGQMRRFANALRPSWLKTIPRVGNNSLRELLTFAQIGLKLRLLGKQDMREFLRVAALPARDLMDENFDNDLLKATLAWDGLIGSRQAPRSPNNTVLTMLYRMIGEHGGAHSLPAGGVEALIEALVSAAREAGAELRLGSAVDRLLVHGDENGLQVTGVTLANGEQIAAARVVSAADPRRTFLQLLGVENLEIEFTNRINRLRCDGYVAKLHLALSGMPEFTGLGRPDGRMVIAPAMDSIEFAWDDAKYGRLPEQPVMEVVIPSLHQPSLAPQGQHVLSAHDMYLPYALAGGWNEEARATLQTRLVDTLCRYAPRLRDQIIHAQLLTPADLEADWNVSGGHWHHTELALDQMLMMRPTYEAAQYATPVPGLYLCSAGSHPGGGIVGAAGRNAANEILK